MRIAGYIEHPRMKISIFSWNERYIVKVEAGLFEQAYKFRQADFPDLESLRRFFDNSFMEDILQTFHKMSKDAHLAAGRMQSGGIA